MLILKDNTLEKIFFHAQCEYPRECCGILLGRQLGEERIAYKVIQTKNMAEGFRQSTHFLIDSLEIAKIEMLAWEEKLEIVGFYHSHPDYEAAASKTDVHHMLAGYSYPIISVINGICTQIKSYEKISQTDVEAKKENIFIKEKENADFGICISNT